MEKNHAGLGSWDIGAQGRENHRQGGIGKGETIGKEEALARGALREGEGMRCRREFFSLTG